MYLRLKAGWTSGRSGSVHRELSEYSFGPFGSTEFCYLPQETYRLFETLRTFSVTKIFSFNQRFIFFQNWRKFRKSQTCLHLFFHTRTVAREFCCAWVFASYLLRVLECRVSVAAVDPSGIRLVHSLIDLHKLLHQSDLFSQHVI